MHNAWCRVSNAESTASDWQARGRDKKDVQRGLTRKKKEKDGVINGDGERRGEGGWVGEKTSRVNSSRVESSRKAGRRDGCGQMHSLTGSPIQMKAIIDKPTNKTAALSKPSRCLQSQAVRTSSRLGSGQVRSDQIRSGQPKLPN